MTEIDSESFQRILLQDRLAAVGLLASSLAHEIGTPLGVIRGRAEMLDLKYPQDEFITKNSQTIVGQVDRISKIVKALLSMARGDQLISGKSIGFGSIIQDVLNLLEHEFRRNRIRIENSVSAGDEIQVCQGVDLPLQQVVLNLVINSIHAIQEAIKRGRLEEHSIKLNLLDLNTNLSLTVTDSGVGIAEENKSKIFQPFFTTKELGKGTGLGLVNSKRIVEAWGGTIEFQSEWGKGSIFAVNLPKQKIL